jgi:DNA invertase Pin-like site-specific DNA recombinase
MRQKNDLKKPSSLRAIAYHRVSTDDQELEQQRIATQAMADYKGWTIVATEEDQGVSGSREQRPGLDAALDRLSRGEADVLVAAKLDRLSRSTTHLLGLAKKAKEEGWHLAIRDLDIDTSHHNGKLVLTVLAAIAEWERDQISVRTKEGLAAKKRLGIVGGRKSAIPDDVAERIRRRREQGHTLAMIADELNEAGIPTPQGGTEWRPSSIQGVVQPTRRKKADRKPLQ